MFHQVTLLWHEKTSDLKEKMMYAVIGCPCVHGKCFSSCSLVSVWEWARATTMFQTVLFKPPSSPSTPPPGKWERNTSQGTRLQPHFGLHIDDLGLFLYSCSLLQPIFLTVPFYLLPWWLELHGQPSSGTLDFYFLLFTRVTRSGLEKEVAWKCNAEMLNVSFSLFRWLVNALRRCGSEPRPPEDKEKWKEDFQLVTLCCLIYLSFIVSFPRQEQVSFSRLHLIREWKRNRGSIKVSIRRVKRLKFLTPFMYYKVQTLQASNDIWHNCVRLDHCKVAELDVAECSFDATGCSLVEVVFLAGLAVHAAPTPQHPICQTDESELLVRCQPQQLAVHCDVMKWRNNIIRAKSCLRWRHCRHAIWAF